MKKNLRNHTRLFDEFILKSWWVILFFLVCLFAYDKSMSKRKKEEARLQEKRAALLLRKQTMSDLKEELKMQITSQKDREWIELVLKRRLGVVPEDEVKVIFKTER